MVSVDAVFLAGAEFNILPEIQAVSAVTKCSVDSTLMRQ